jgi:hypothetical protein
MAGSDVIINLLEEVDRIRPIIKEHASSAEANRQLSSAVYDAMYDAGLFAMFAPSIWRPRATSSRCPASLGGRFGFRPQV